MKKLMATLLTIVISISFTPKGGASEASYQVPQLVDFQSSKKVVDVQSSDSTIKFSLTVSHPNGIRSTQTTLWMMSRDEKTILKTSLVRNPQLDKSGTATFIGLVQFEPSTKPGIYDFYADPISAEPSGQSRVVPISPALYPQAFNDFPNAEKSILVRSQGKLNLSEKTFVGPSHSSLESLNDGKPVIYKTKRPIFRVGENYNPNDFFVFRVSNLTLKVTSFTPEVCESKNSELQFLSIGTCSFEVYTDSNNDYLKTSVRITAEISQKRTKPLFSLPSVPNQNVSDLPKQITTALVMTTSGYIIQPINKTPEVCYAIFQFITVVGGGTCILQYQSPENETYLSSEIQQLVFEVEKKNQVLNFSTPKSISLTAKALELTATASSGRKVVFSSTTPQVCLIAEANLILLKAGNCGIMAKQSGDNIYNEISANETIIVQGNTKGEAKKCRKSQKRENKKCRVIERQ